MAAPTLAGGRPGDARVYVGHRSAGHGGALLDGAQVEGQGLVAGGEGDRKQRAAPRVLLHKGCHRRVHLSRLPRDAS
eukprot:1909908-Rhodomonas_salina.1